MDSIYWEPEVETLPRKKLEGLQLERLKKTLENVYANVSFYRKRLNDVGIDPVSFNSLDDLEKVPFTLKDDLRDNYPFEMFARSMKQVVRIHSSSGTTGNPTVVGYTREDLDMWADVLARIMYDIGTRRNDVVQVSHGFGLFTGGFGFQAAAETIGSMMVPVREEIPKDS